MIVIIVSNQYFTEEIIHQERDKNGKPIQLLFYYEVHPVSKLLSHLNFKLLSNQ